MRNWDLHTSIWGVTCYSKSFTMSRTDGASSSHFLRALLADTMYCIVGFVNFRKLQLNRIHTVKALLEPDYLLMYKEHGKFTRTS